MVVLDGKLTSSIIRQELAEKVKSLKLAGKKVPHLAAILVGEDGASKTYVNAKVRDCEEVGFGSTLIKLPSETTEKELLKAIAKLNNDEDVDGYIASYHYQNMFSVDAFNHPCPNFNGGLANLCL